MRKEKEQNMHSCTYKSPAMPRLFHHRLNGGYPFSSVINQNQSAFTQRPGPMLLPLATGHAIPHHHHHHPSQLANRAQCKSQIIPCTCAQCCYMKYVPSSGGSSRKLQSKDGRKEGGKSLTWAACIPLATK